VHRFRLVPRFLRARALHCPRRFRLARQSLPSGRLELRVLCSPTWPVPPAVRVRRRVRRPPAVRCPVSRCRPVLPSDQFFVVTTAPPSSTRGRCRCVGLNTMRTNGITVHVHHCGRGGLRRLRYSLTTTGSPTLAVLKYHSASAGLRLMQPWLMFSRPSDWTAHGAECTNSPRLLIRLA
jgi:hypothetical protein